MSFLVASFNVVMGSTGGLLILSFSLILNPLSAISNHALVSAISSLSRSIIFIKDISYKLVLELIIISIPGYCMAYLVKDFISLKISYLIIGLYFLTSNIRSKNNIIKNPRLSILLGSFATLFIGGSGALITPAVYSLSKSRQKGIANKSIFLFFHHLPKVFIIDFSYLMNYKEIIILILLTFLGNLFGKYLLKHIKEKYTFSYIKIISLTVSFILIIKSILMMS